MCFAGFACNLGESPFASQSGERLKRIRGGQSKLLPHKNQPWPALTLSLALDSPETAITGSGPPLIQAHEALMGPRSRNACNRTGDP